MISGSADGTLWLWNGNNGENLMVFNGHEKAVNQVNFTPDGILRIFRETYFIDF